MVGVYQQLIWARRELRGERVLRRGWEAECRRVLEQNRVLRAELEARLPRSAGAPESGLQQSLSRVGRTFPIAESTGILCGAEGHHEGRKR